MGILTNELFSSQDLNYKIFSKKLIPDTKYPIIGVRAPIIKNIAKKISKNTDLCFDFLSETHIYYEEWLLHGFLLGYIDCEFDLRLQLVDKFLPNIDNWAICDSTVMNLKIFKKYKDITLKKAREWINSDMPYIVRFAIVVFLSYFLTENNFNCEILELVSSITSQNYYVKMAIAWFFSVSLVKQYDNSISYIKNKKLEKFIHNKTIQKAVDSYRISTAQKNFLRKLKI